MGACKYCKKPAGMLKDCHKECHDAYEGGKSKICALVGLAMVGKSSTEEIENEVSTFANRWAIDMPEIKPILVEGWHKALYVALEDGIITEQEEANLNSMKEFFALGQDDLDANGAYTKCVKACVLREVMSGNIPTAFKTADKLPINMQKGEIIVWGFQNVELLEQRNRTQYVGGYAGASIRIANGLYFSTGDFEGNPIVTTQMVLVDKGIFLVTDRHIYFHGILKSFRIPYKKIVSYQPYDDGIGVSRDSASATPQIFKTGDGWFTYNLVSNLANIEM